MTIFLWILQVGISLHTLMGAVWKFKNSAEQTMPSLKAIPNGIWMGLGGIEIICSLALILPALYKPSGPYVPIAAVIIALEMITFTGIHFASGNSKLGAVIYWLVVALICGFIAYGRFVSNPLAPHI
ncbi:MAG: hypothetical protein EOP07_16040 [Proteobacteria bacterium]|nr:MAG: hypothetical protein EOP07_16040 [Pseudomonadota bacterium]